MRKGPGRLLTVLAVMASSLVVGRAEAATALADGVPIASGAVFAVTPPSGPAGTQIRVASVTPCAVPTTPGQVVQVEFSQFMQFSDVILPPRTVFFPVQPNGSWSGTLPPETYQSGPVQIDASCQTNGGPPVIYATQYFRQTPSGRGYWLATTAEVGIPCFCPPPGPPTNIVTFGDARYEGSPADFSTTIPLVAMAAQPVTGLGYWLAASDGGVFSFGDAPFLGSAATTPLRRPIVGMAATPTGRGYWLVASDGGVFGFGDARFFGSAATLPLRKPIVGMAASPTGRGYWLVASDGGVFAFGDARFSGSTGGTALNMPVVGMAATPSGAGYWLVASDGGLFAFGNARFSGSAAGIPLSRPVVAMAATASGRGYWLLGADGGIFAFGDANFQGSCSGCVAHRGRTSFVAMAATPDTRTG